MRLLAGRPVKLVSMRQALDDAAYFGGLLEGDSWRAWRILLIAICGEELTDGERYTFERLTGRDREPGAPVSAFWGVIGRRGGKSRCMGVLAAYLSACVDYRPVLVRGEKGTLPVLAASVTQANVMFGYISGVFAASPILIAMVESETGDTIRLHSGVDIVIRPANHRTIRGATAIGAICDELASWQTDDGSRNPDTEILRALRPALATTGGPLICISSPRARVGELYKAFQRHFGLDGNRHVLVARATTRAMNPSLPQSAIDREYEEDAESARAEFDVEWRDDLSSFVGLEAINACVAHGVTVRAPLASVSYMAATDPSGGSNDAMTAAIVHRERDRVVLDCVLERRAPFSPDSVVSEFAATLKSYRISTVTGDRYAGEWPRERFAVHGIRYEPAELNRSEAYLAFLPLVNSGRVDLLDNARMVSQFAALERRVNRSGKDTVDHPKGAHDDVANSVALAAVRASAGPQPFVITDDLLAWASRPGRSASQDRSPRSWLPDKFIPFG